MPTLNAAQDISGLLLSAGVSAAMASAAVPSMFLTPNNSDPAMSSVQTIIRGLQIAMNRMGAGLAVDGVMGPRTGTALRQVVPSQVVIGTSKWWELYAYVLGAERAGGRITPPAPAPTPGVPPTAMLPTGVQTAGFGDLGQLLSNPWYVGGALALIYLATRKKGKKR